MKRNFQVAIAASVAFAVSGCNADELIRTAGPMPPEMRISPVVLVPTAAGSDAYTRGIHYFSGWRTPEPLYHQLNYGECGRSNGDFTLTNSDVPHPRPWDQISQFAGPLPRKPLLGYYDDAVQTTSDDQILAMIDAGYDYAIYQIGWSHLRWGGTGTSGLTRDQAVVNHKASPHASRLKFSVMWDDANSQYNGTSHTPISAATTYWNHLQGCGWTASTYNSSLTALYNLWFGDYAQNANFHRYNGRPVVFFFNPQNLKTPYTVLGGNSKAPDAIALLRSVAAQHGFSGSTAPYVVGTNVADEYVDSLRLWGFDASTGYVYRPSGQNKTFADAQSTYTGKWAELYDKTYLYAPEYQYWVPNANAVDARPWGGENVWTATASQFETLVKSSMDFASANATVTGGNLVSCCWNEWGEGPSIEPSTMDYGYSYRGSALSDAHRRTVLNQTAGSNRIPDGNFDEVQSSGFSYGWAVDPDTPNSRLLVHIYVDAPYPTGTHIAWVWTTVLRGDINSSHGIAGTHGWEYTISSAHCGKKIYIHLIDTSGNDENPVGHGSGKTYTC